MIRCQSRISNGLELKADLPCVRVHSETALGHNPVYIRAGTFYMISGNTIMPLSSEYRRSTVLLGSTDKKTTHRAIRQNIPVSDLGLLSD